MRGRGEGKEWFNGVSHCVCIIDPALLPVGGDPSGMADTSERANDL